MRKSSGEAIVARIEAHVDEQLDERVRTFAQESGQSVSEVVRRGLAYVTSEPGPYRFHGAEGPSLLRDMFAVRTGTGEHEAEERLRRFQRWHGDVSARFAANTTDHAAVVPPGYQAAPFVSSLIEDRPLRAALSPVLTLPNPTPFTLPTTVTSTGATSDHTEGANPTEATIAIGGETVQPAGIHGMYRLTRELVDASSPAADAVALQEMRESYARQTEAAIAAEIDRVQSGTVTGDRSPAGAQVYTATAAELKATMVKFATARRGRPRHVLLSPAIAEAAADVLDDSTGDDTAMWRSMGARINPALAIAGGAGALSGVILAAGDVYCWESPVLTFRFDERQGPTYVDLALYGYFACRVLRPIGVGAIRDAAA